MSFPELFAVRICRGYLPWEFGVGICRGYLPLVFCLSYLPLEFAMVFFVYVIKPFFFVSKSSFFVSNPVYMEAKHFFIYESFFVNSASFCYCRGNYGTTVDFGFLFRILKKTYDLLWSMLKKMFIEIRLCNLTSFVLKCMSKSL